MLRADGVLSWGRVVVLLCFGYRAVVAAVRQGLGVLCSRLVRFVVQFFVSERIVHWVDAHGGWVSSQFGSVCSRASGRICWLCWRLFVALADVFVYSLQECGR